MFWLELGKKIILLVKITMISLETCTLHNVTQVMYVTQVHHSCNIREAKVIYNKLVESFIYHNMHNITEKQIPCDSVSRGKVQCTV